MLSGAFLEHGDLTLRSLLRSLICVCGDGTGSCYSFQNK